MKYLLKKRILHFAYNILLFIIQTLQTPRNIRTSITYIKEEVLTDWFIINYVRTVKTIGVNWGMLSTPQIVDTIIKFLLINIVIYNWVNLLLKPHNLHNNNTT